MSCSSCANTIEKSVKKIQGVKNVNVNFATEKLNVEYNEKNASIDDIKEAVKDAGYNVENSKDIREVTIPIKGMTCSSCAQTVEKEIKRLKGISEVNVNFATEKAKVTYDPYNTRISEIKKAIEIAGYEPLEMQSEDQVDDEKKEDKKR
ncbi:MAG: copper ion binding protein [Tissierella sp.]|uniref:copper ion binding protein n=1 Tax=Tissierella sp. TaxID=41274 RepID=UPI003F95134D